VLITRLIFFGALPYMPGGENFTSSMSQMMKYRLPSQAPEQLGYERIKFNLAESSVRDRSLRELGLNLEETQLCYDDHLGLPGLRKLMAEQGDGLSEDDILVTAGASAALFIIATSLLGKGDHIVVARPNYATNIETPRAIGCDISYLELTHENQYRVDIDELESLFGLRRSM
jgi:aspartate/methionine/tyrosine aminotransferase